MARKNRNVASLNLLSRVDCQIEVYQEKIPGSGEDAYVYSMNTDQVLIGAFDGCGGAGAKRYGKLQGKTGAYIASRVVSGTLRDWFSEYSVKDGGDIVKDMKGRIQENLRICDSVGAEESKLVSPMVKSFPTTAAIALISEQNKMIQVDYFWAGDSRVYLFNSDGLAQLSVDDLSVSDAMENLYDDGVMTNVISKSKDFILHHGSVIMDKPGIVLAATDGCFGYLSTPMEFEYMLAQKLLESQSVAEWEQKLSDAMAELAGDDYTLIAVALDFGGFEVMQMELADRVNKLYTGFISQISGYGKAEKVAAWNRYKDNYYRLQKSVRS